MTEKSDDAHGSGDAADIFTEMLRIQGEAARQVMASFAPQAAGSVPDAASIDAMGEAMLKLQSLWLDPVRGPNGKGGLPIMADPSQWLAAMQAWYSANPALDPDAARETWSGGGKSGLPMPRSMMSRPACRAACRIAFTSAMT